MRPAAIALTAVAAAVMSGAALGQQKAPLTPTRVIRLESPPSLPGQAVEATCSPSLAASFRPDARRCITAGGATLDPCVPTPQVGRLWCLADPRRPGDGRLIRVVSEHSRADPAALGQAWFLELEDGSTCRPIPGGGRVIDGAQEVYACVFVVAGESDVVVLGDVNQGAPAWTLQKASLNKKSLPVTIKSLSIVTVARAWQ